ncbi:MAG TPA: hypothetical protein VGA38_02745 [Candidatus Limnocylindria bacterium]
MLSVALSDRELGSIQIRLDAALSRWPPTPAALRELVALAREDLPLVLADLRQCRAGAELAGEGLDAIEESAS